MKKRSTQFYNWLNAVIFFKNGYITKQTYDDKRITACNEHKAIARKFRRRHY